MVTAFNEKMDKMRKNQIYAELKRYKNFIIICGFGRVGREAVRQLANDGQKFIIIDKREQNVTAARELGYLVIHDDASKNDVLINAGINRGATAVVCTTGNDVINVYVTLTSRHLNPGIRIIARANRHDNINKLYQAGANNVILPFEIAGLLAAEYLGQPVAFEAILGILQDQKSVVMETIVVSKHSMLEDKAIIDIHLESRKMTLLGVISENPIHLKHKNKYPVKHQHFYFNPEPHFQLRDQDMLVLLGRKLSIDHFRNQVEQSRLLKWKKT
jgi:voltage-gated potassium channel